jgi:hypothetical protein
MITEKRVIIQQKKKVKTNFPDEPDIFFIKLHYFLLGYLIAFISMLVIFKW